MKPLRMRIVRVGLLVTFALVATTVGSASASEPALYQCGVTVKNAEKHYTGGYNNRTCSEANGKHEGKYELEEWRDGSRDTGGKKGRVPRKFRTIGYASLHYETPGLGVTPWQGCTVSLDEGKITGPKSAGHIQATLTGCLMGPYDPCSNTGVWGEVRSNPLQFVIGYVDKAEHRVGFEISSELREGPEAGVIAAFQCGKQGEETKHHIRWSGAVIGEVISPLNTLTRNTKLRFRQTADKQEWEKLEELPVDFLSASSCIAVTPETCEPEGAYQTGWEMELEMRGEELDLKG